MSGRVAGFMPDQKKFAVFVCSNHFKKAGFYWEKKICFICHFFFNATSQKQDDKSEALFPGQLYHNTEK